MATKAVKDSFVRGAALRDALAQDTDPYVGELPPEMAAQFPGKNRQALLEGMDSLATALREIFPAMAMFSSKGKQSDQRFKPIQVRLGNREVTVSEADVRLLGPGEWAVTYRLDIGKHAYAFKVYYDPEHDDRSFGAYSDLAAGVHLTGNRVTRDMMKTYIGNPVNGWSLLEYLGSDVDRVVDHDARSLREAGFFFPFDQYSEDNYIDGVRIDSGGCYNDRKEQYDHSGYYINHYMGMLNGRARQVQTVSDYDALLKEEEALEKMRLDVSSRRFRLPGRQSPQDVNEALEEVRTARWGIWSNLDAVAESESDRFAIFQRCMRAPFYRRHFAYQYQEVFSDPEYRSKALALILEFPDSRHYMFAHNNNLGLPPGEEQGVQSLMATFADCLGIRIGRGEFQLLPEFFSRRHPALVGRVKE